MQININQRFKSQIGPDHSRYTVINTYKYLVASFEVRNFNWRFVMLTSALPAIVLENHKLPGESGDVLSI